MTCHEVEACYARVKAKGLADTTVAEQTAARAHVQGCVACRELYLARAAELRRRNPVLSIVAGIVAADMVSRNERDPEAVR